MKLVRALYFRIQIARALRRYRHATRLSGEWTAEALRWRGIADSLIAESKSPTANR